MKVSYCKFRIAPTQLIQNLQYDKGIKLVLVMLFPGIDGWHDLEHMTALTTKNYTSA